MLDMVSYSKLLIELQLVTETDGRTPNHSMYLTDTDTASHARGYKLSKYVRL